MCVVILFDCFFFKQKTAYEMRISDWSSDVCSSDLLVAQRAGDGGRLAGRDLGVPGIAVDRRDRLEAGLPHDGCGLLGRGHGELEVAEVDVADRKSVV